MKDQMLKVAIILGSTRPGRNGEAVSHWIYEIAKKRRDADFELVDIKDFNLPLLDEPISAAASMGQYSKENTKIWSAKIDSFDAYVFVTAEYNHGIPGALKNAIDFLYKEWNNKVAGFVSYGGAGGVRAVEQLRLAMAELYVATVRSQVQLSLFTDFENFTKFKPAPYNEKSVNDMLDQVISWGSALKTLRTKNHQIKYQGVLQMLSSWSSSTISMQNTEHRTGLILQSPIQENLQKILPNIPMIVSSVSNRAQTNLPLIPNTQEEMR